ncbi:uncharacterized protein NPIL_366001 [Nephila pilipes]|uniref:Uncharacterized protein n=1 Tax=Nephila pilipes TaxID=299642 RepID=A0A8X6UCX3_NEPPI|nr:uncharacterized protein NPIL_366001 [Nephila pilipes]
MSHYRLQCWHINGLDLSLNRTLQFRNHFGILQINFMFQISPQKPITRFEVMRIRCPVDVHYCVIRMTQNNHTILKGLFQQSKHVEGVMWSSTILHKPHQIEFEVVLKNRDEIIGQYVTIEFTIGSSIDKKGSVYSSG